MEALRAKLARWLDEWKLALAGVGLALRSWKFCLVVALVFVFFATLFNMLSFTSSFQYLWNLPDFGRKLGYLGQMFLGVFGYRKANLMDFLPILLISILQAFLIGLVVLVWWKKRRAPKSVDAGKGTASATNAGIVTGLAVLAGGCPSCGTSLLMPIVGTIFTGSSAVIGETLSWVLTLLAFVIALISFKKIGLDAYVIIVSERRRARRDDTKLKTNRKK